MNLMELDMEKYFKSRSIRPL